MAEIVENEDLRLLRIEQVFDLVPVGRTTLYRMIEEGAFPSPVKFGRTSLWPCSEVRAWIEEQKMRRSQVKPRRGADLI